MRIKALLVVLLPALLFGPAAARADQEMPIFDVVFSSGRGSS